MDDDDFLELYGSADEPVPSVKGAATSANGAYPQSYQPAPLQQDDDDELFGQLYGSTNAEPAQTPYKPPAAGQATPFARGAAGHMLHSTAATLPQQQQQQQHVQQPQAPAAAPRAAQAADDDGSEDFEIDLDDDTGPTPAPKAALTAAAAAAAGGPHSASKGVPAGPPAAGRVPSTHMQYVRPGLEPQQQQQQQAGFPGPPHAGFGPGGMMQQGSGGLMGHGSGQMGAPHQQQQQQQHYSLPVAAGGMMPQQGGLPGAPHVPGPRPPPGGPRPPAAPYPGGAAAGGVPPPRPPPEPPQLNFIPMGTAGYQVADALRNMDAAFPSAAAPQQPIKLPRQHNVDKDEYREFLNLGHGEIFNLDLDRVTTAPWRTAGADISDFFNYGLTERTWRQYQSRIARFRAAYEVRNKIKVLQGADGAEEQLMGLPAEVVFAVQQYRSKHPSQDTPPQHASFSAPRMRGRDYKRQQDEGVILVLLAATQGLSLEGPDTAAGEEGAAAGVNAAGGGDQPGGVSGQVKAKAQQKLWCVGGGDYDGPDAVDLVISGLPKLPPNTIAPHSPSSQHDHHMAQQEGWEGQGQGGMMQQLPPGSPSQQQSGGLRQQGSMSMAHQQQQHQQLALHRRSSTTSAGLAGLEEDEGVEGGGGGGPAGGTQQGVGPNKLGRGLQVMLAPGRTAAPQQQQQQQQQQAQDFDDEDGFGQQGAMQQQQHQQQGGSFSGGQQQYGAFDSLDDDFDAPMMRQQGSFGLQQHHQQQFQGPDAFGALADEAFEGGGFGGAQQQQPGFMGGGQNPNMGGTWEDDFDWEAGGGGGMQQGMRMGGGMSMGGGMAMNGNDWGGGDAMMGDGGGWGQEDGMMGRMGGQMSNQLGPEADTFAGGSRDDGGFAADGMGYGPGPGAGGFGPGGMRGPGPMGGGPGGGLPPGNAAGSNPNACFNCGASDHMARNCPHPKDFATQCHNCGEMGHRAKDCPNPSNQPPPPAMMQQQRGGPGWGPSDGGPGRGGQGGCFNCGQPGHMARDCPKPPAGRPPPPRFGGPPPPGFGGPPPPPPRSMDRGSDRADGDGGEWPAGGPRGSGPGSCFKCGQEGHLARDCPNPPASPPAPGSKPPPAPPVCYNCGEEGHYARECPQGPPPRTGSFERWQGSGGAACFNCGQEGHMARDCPAPKGGGGGAPLPPPHMRGGPPFPPPHRGGPGRGGSLVGRPLPPPFERETPEERAAREAEIDRRLRDAEHTRGGVSSRDRGEPPVASSSRGVISRDREREAGSMKRSRSGGLDDGVSRRGSRSEEREEKRSSSRQGHRSRSKDRDKSSSKHSKKPSSRSRERSSRKHSSKHRSRSRGRSRSRSRSRSNSRWRLD